MEEVTQEMVDDAMELLTDETFIEELAALFEEDVGEEAAELRQHQEVVVYHDPPASGHCPANEEIKPATTEQLARLRNMR